MSTQGFYYRPMNDKQMKIATSAEVLNKMKTYGAKLQLSSTKDQSGEKLPFTSKVLRDVAGQPVPATSRDKQE
jgi:hypothetical protein